MVVLSLPAILFDRCSCCALCIRPFVFLVGFSPIWAFHLSSKDFCVGVYPARVTHALRGLLVRFFMILFIMGLVRNDSLLCRRDDLFNETVEAAVGQDACYLYV
jgi:hypothetical protein